LRRGAAFLLLLHLPPLTLPFVGWRAADAWAFGVLFLTAAAGVGVGLHRYFAHRSFETSRAGQLVLGLLAASAFGDPIGFSGKHRLHHRRADAPNDVHSPRQGFWRCWFGSLLDDGCTPKEVARVTPDLARFAELRWLHRHHHKVALALGIATFALGGYSMFALGFCLSRVVAIHLSSAVNYFGHDTGSRRYQTGDLSTNNPWLALLTFGEGWHNNHHRYPRAARAGFAWWELDLFYCGLRVLARLGLVWNVREVPLAVRREGGLA
jgi:fatty-acid desaturase